VLCYVVACFYVSASLPHTPLVQSEDISMAHLHAHKPAAVEATVESGEASEAVLRL